MLDAVAFEDGDGAVVAFDGEGDGEAATRVFGAVADGVGQVDGVGGLVELTAGHFEDVGIVERRNDSFRHKRRETGFGWNGQGDWPCCLSKDWVGQGLWQLGSGRGKR